MNFASQVTFTTDSDCEVLLHLYKEYGPHFLKKVKQIWILDCATLPPFLFLRGVFF